MLLKLLVVRDDPILAVCNQLVRQRLAIYRDGVPLSKRLVVVVVVTLNVATRHVSNEACVV